MANRLYNGKKVIWESKFKQISLILGCFAFVGMAIYVYRPSNVIGCWVTGIFFGIGGIFALFNFLNPQNLFVTHSSSLGREIISQWAKEAEEDLGFFSYSEEGFSFITTAETSYYKWADIASAFGYKRDMITTDEIYLDIFFQDKVAIRLNESMAGWQQFNKQIHQNVPSIPEYWYMGVAVPAFNTNLTLLYDSDGRTLEDAQTYFYQ